MLAELADATGLIEAERVLSLEEFAALTREVLAQARIDQSSQQPAQAVQAFSVLDARGLDFDLVFLLGLEDGGFPHYRSEDPILPDDLRVALNRPLAARLQARFGHSAPATLRKILRTSNERNSEDRFLFFLALSMPERRVVLSYPRSDKQGNPYVRSPFVEEVLRLLGYPEQPSLRQCGRQGLIAELEDCFEQHSFLNWSANRSLLAGPEVGVIAERSRLSSIERRIEVERRRERYLAIATREQQASAQSSPERLGLVDHTTAGACKPHLDRAIFCSDRPGPLACGARRVWTTRACGFKFFASRVLRLGEEEAIDYEPSALDVGGLVHDVLHDLFSEPI